MSLISCQNYWRSQKYYIILGWQRSKRCCLFLFEKNHPWKSTIVNSAWVLLFAHAFINNDKCTKCVLRINSTEVCIPWRVFSENVFLSRDQIFKVFTDLHFSLHTSIPVRFNSFFSYSFIVQPVKTQILGIFRKKVS